MGHWDHVAFLKFCCVRNEYMIQSVLIETVSVCVPRTVMSMGQNGLCSILLGMKRVLTDWSGGPVMYYYSPHHAACLSKWAFLDPWPASASWAVYWAEYMLCDIHTCMIQQLSCVRQTSYFKCAGSYLSYHTLPWLTQSACVFCTVCGVATKHLALVRSIAGRQDSRQAGRYELMPTVAHTTWITIHIQQHGNPRQGKVSLSASLPLSQYECCPIHPHGNIVLFMVSMIIGVWCLW